jgi:hypothetical protein
VIAWATGRGEGDLRVVDPRPCPTPVRHRRLVDRPWTLTRQVHGASVARVDVPGGPRAEEADGLVATHGQAAIAVLGADCPLIGLASPEGLFAVAHAGWRGLVAGVVEATVAALSDAGASHLRAVLSPCIHPECYAFGARDLETVVARLGAGVVGHTADGALALDLPAAVAAALGHAGVEPPVRLGGCTACEAAGFSHRARREHERHALVLWREDASTDAPAPGAVSGTRP